MSDFDDFLRDYDIDRLWGVVYRASVQRNPKQNIQDLQPHYTNPYYKQPRTVYLAKGYKTVVGNQGYESVEGASYNYSDRLWQWDYNGALAATEAATQEEPNTKCAAFWEAYLRHYFGKPDLVLVHIMAGFNLSNGYPYQVFGYITND